MVAVNNNGVVAGSINSNTDDGCIQQGYLWDSNHSKFVIIHTLKIPNYNVSGFRLSVLSTNLVSGGITFAKGGFEFATQNDFITPDNSIINWNYVFGISENGQYIVGTTPFGSYLFFDNNRQQQINLTYNGTPIQNSTELLNSSDNGIAVGAIVENQLSRAIICKADSSNCTAITGDTTDGYNKSWVTSISSNGKIAYGYALNLRSDSSQLFSVNPNNNNITPLFESYFITKTITSDDGLVVVTSLDMEQYGIYDPTTNSIYSLNELANKLKLPNNIDISSTSISPNGKFLAFDIKDYSKNTFGVKIFFPLGIANYIHDNLSAIATTHSKAIWFN